MTGQNEGLVDFKSTVADHIRRCLISEDVEYHTEKICEKAKAILAKAKPSIEKQERERIIAWGIEPCPHWHMYPDVGVIKRDCSQCWQALKSS